MAGLIAHFESTAGSEVTQEAYSRNRAKKVVQSSARYQDAVLRGRCFAGNTAVTGVAPGTTISTTAGFALYNPFASGVYLSVLRATLDYISGTLGAGTIFWAANVNPAAAATTGTAITSVNLLLGAGYAAQGKPLTTATVPVAPTLLRAFASLGASLAGTAEKPWQIIDNVDGEFVVNPGCTLVLHAAAAAGSTPLVAYGVMWEEIPIG